jgi:hypothetical protein
MENKNILLKFVQCYKVHMGTDSQMYVRFADPSNANSPYYSITIEMFDDVLAGRREDVTYYKVDNVLHLLFERKENGKPKLYR